MAEPTELFARPYNIVKEQVDMMTSRAQTAVDQANNIIAMLSSVDLPDVTQPNKYSEDNVEAQGDIDFVSPSGVPDSNLFGGVNPGNFPGDPGDGSSLLTGIDFNDFTIPEFESSIGSLNIPEPPPNIDTSGLPERPTIEDIDLPDAPDVQIPSLGALTDIQIPDFTFPDLPDFEGQSPQFYGTNPRIQIDYTEPVYASETLDEVKASLTELFAGGTGIPKAVEEAIFSRVAEREDGRGRVEVQQAFDDWAARGFDMPPGMLNRQVAAAREDARERVSQANRDVFVQAAQYEIENLRFAVQQGIAIEGTLINLFNNAAARSLDMAKSRLDADIAFYNAQVGLFNARQNAYQVEADVFRARLEGALSSLQVYRARIDGQQAIAQTNEQVVRAFNARVDALRSTVDIYNARVSGAQVRAQVQSQRIDAYRADIQAYGSRLDADKTRFDAYDSRIQGERGKADILDAQARAYASTVQAQQGRTNIKVEEIRARVSALQAATQQFSAKVGAERDRVAADAQVIGARSQAYQADVGRYSAEINKSRSENELKQRVTQDKLRNNIAYYEIEARQYDAKLARLVQQAQVQVSAVTAAGQMASQLAAGAMSALNVGASVSGSASQGVTETFSYNKQL